MKFTYEIGYSLEGQDHITGVTSSQTGLPSFAAALRAATNHANALADIGMNAEITSLTIQPMTQQETK